MVDFRRLNESLDALAVVRALGIEIAWVFSAQIRCRCPFHQSKSGRSMSVGRSARHWYCHSRECHQHGDLIDLWARLRGVSLPTAAREMKERFG
jgi:hypothetical protein